MSSWASRGNWIWPLRFFAPTIGGGRQIWGCRRSALCMLLVVCCFGSFCAVAGSGNVLSLHLLSQELCVGSHWSRRLICRRAVVCYTCAGTTVAGLYIVSSTLLTWLWNNPFTAFITAKHSGPVLFIYTTQICTAALYLLWLLYFYAIFLLFLYSYGLWVFWASKSTWFNA